MELFETISKRKTIRKYKQEQPPIEDIKRIINSARIAPSAVNAQNWKFIAIYNDKVKQDMANSVIEAYNDLMSKTLDENVRQTMDSFKNYSIFFKDAPVVIACVENERISAIQESMKNSGMSLEEILLYRPDSSLLSMGGAIENMILSATELGYGTCWMCAPIVAYKEFKKILKLEENDKIVTLLTIGKPFDDTTKQPPKKTLEEVMQIIE